MDCKNINWIVKSREITVEEDDEGFMNLTMDNSISSQVKQQIILAPEHYYFVMFDVKVTRYNKGLLDLHVNGQIQTAPSSFGLRRVSKNRDYETITGIIKTESPADGTGQIRKLSLYDLTEIYGKGNEPIAQDFYANMQKIKLQVGLKQRSRKFMHH